jgi:outer membrane protein insertion porin family
MTRLWAGIAALHVLACGGATDVATAPCNTDVREAVVVHMQSAYYDRGHLSARLDGAAEAACGDAFTIAIDEGPRYRYGRIEVHDGEADPQTAERMRALFSFPAGEFYDRAVVARRVERALREYRDAGRALAAIAPETTLRGEVVDLRFSIDRGPEVHIERIDVNGADPESCALAREQLRVAAGELFHQTRLDQSRHGIELLNRFERVDVSTERGAQPDQVVVHIDLVPHDD